MAVNESASANIRRRGRLVAVAAAREYDVLHRSLYRAKPRGRCRRKTSRVISRERRNSVRHHRRYPAAAINASHKWQKYPADFKSIMRQRLQGSMSEDLSAGINALNRAAPS